MIEPIKVWKYEDAPDEVREYLNTIIKSILPEVDPEDHFKDSWIAEVPTNYSGTHISWLHFSETYIHPTNAGHWIYVMK